MREVYNCNEGEFNKLTHEIQKMTERNAMPDKILLTGKRQRQLFKARKGTSIRCKPEGDISAQAVATALVLASKKLGVKVSQYKVNEFHFVRVLKAIDKELYCI